MTNIEIFSERLKELLPDEKIETFAQKVGIDASLIYKYLRSEYFPSTENAIKLANCFECSLNYLFGLNDEFSIFQYKTDVNFAAQFKKILKENNCYRNKIVKEKHLSRDVVDDWFHGVRLPSIDSLIILAEYFDCSIDYLLGREN